MDNVSEQDLPGIGRSYTIGCANGARVMAVLHHSGRRDLYVLDDEHEPDEPTAIVSLTDDQARQLGAVLSGAYFKPAVVAEVEAVIGGLLIDWLTVRPDSPAAGRSIAELEVRQKTGMTVAAIVRPDGSSIVAPGPHEVMRPDDQVVVIGRPQDLPAFRALAIEPS